MCSMSLLIFNIIFYKINEFQSISMLYLMLCELYNINYIASTDHNLIYTIIKRCMQFH